MPYKDPQKAKEFNKIYYQNNKSRLGELGKEWRLKNPDKIKAIYARYRSTEKRRKVARNWARRNRKSIMERFVERYHSDPEFNLAIKFRRRIYMAIRNRFTKKAKSTIELLGCSYPELKEHIEKQFTDTMTWKLLLKGKIHIDHIRPISSFNLLDAEQQKVAFHYTNLQPLWKEDNMSKGSKFETAEDPEFRECWALANLQPLEAIVNLKKGNKFR